MEPKFWELRVCLLLVGIVAGLMSIARTVWVFYGGNL
jgi:hypothetical protein